MHHDVVEDHVEHNAFDDNDLNDLLAYIVTIIYVVVG